MRPRKLILIPPGAFTPIHSFGIPSSSSQTHTTRRAQPAPHSTAQPSSSTTISHSLLRLSARASHPLREHLRRLTVTRHTSARTTTIPPSGPASQLTRSRIFTANNPINHEDHHLAALCGGCSDRCSAPSPCAPAPARGEARPEPGRRRRRRSWTD